MSDKKKSPPVLLLKIKVLFLSPFSQDKWTRVFGIGFYFSLFLFILSIVFLLNYMGKNKKVELTAEEQAALIAEKKRLEDEKKVYQFKLGEFRMPYRSHENAQGKNIPLPLANVELVVRCESESTCKYIERNLVRVKDIVSSSLVPLSREELLKPEGKQKIKNAVMEKLNEWLPQGRIIDVFFPKLILG